MKKLITTILLLIVLSFPLAINASSPFITQSPDRYNRLTQTQDAYEPFNDIRTYDGAFFNAPQDIFIDQDYIYVADTGNKTIVIMDLEGNYIYSFGKEELIKPMGIYVADKTIYVADYGSDSDLNSGRIWIYQYDSAAVSVTLLKSYQRPNSLALEKTNYTYRPLKIAVDKNKTMYVISQGSYNGVMMINENNRFLNFFAANSVKATLLDYVLKIFYGQQEETNLKKKIPPEPSNVFFKDSGYLYTLTQTSIVDGFGDTVKKVNNGGINFFPTKMITTGEFSDLYLGNIENLYVVTKSGFIYEYDREGNLLFVFGGSSDGIDRVGLFKNTSGIAVSTDNKIYVLDDANNNIHIIKPTAYANVVHQALELYNQGKYIESEVYWEEVLTYNSMFDLAHEGIGRSYLMQARYQEAMEKFQIANNKEMYSQAMWEVRNEFLQKYSGFLILAIVLVYLIGFALSKFNQRFKIISNSNTIFKAKNNQTLQETKFMFNYIKKPLDSFYEGKAKEKLNLMSLVIYLFGLLVLYIMHLTLSGFAFLKTPLEQLNLVEELAKVIVPVVIFIFANYLTSSLMEGEGTFKSITINTFGSLAPIYLLLPILIALSNVMTLNEGFLYHLGFVVMFGWVFFLIFFMIKDTHNYSVKETIYNLLLTIFVMIVIIIALVMAYMMVMQVFEFVIDIVKEVMISG
ncbi:MAG: hypothetical protein GX149_05700 [Acholeplasmataceae bacterium]|jgi:hypothetical protein|nr:hypothetical protein [Acholeplasmataceae bacterium]